MRKDIVNTERVLPIVHERRDTYHKTFGESREHGDFTFNNEDYRKGNFLVKTFGHRKFILMFWQLFFPMLFYGALTALVGILFSVLVHDVYHHNPIGAPIYMAFEYSMGKFNYINIFVATAWVLMAYPVVGNYIAKKRYSDMREAIRFVFYLMFVMSTIALIFEYIYAPQFAIDLVWRWKDASAYNLANLKSQYGQAVSNTGAYWTDVKYAYQLQYSVVAIRYFTFSSYLAGWTSLYVPLFASRRKNRVLIISTLFGVILFLVSYLPYLYTHNPLNANDYLKQFTMTQDGHVAHVKLVASFVPYVSFYPLISVSCGLYLFYLAVIPFFMFLFTLFPKLFKLIALSINFWFKKTYNTWVDKRSRYEYNVEYYNAKKNEILRRRKYIEDKIAFLNMRLTLNPPESSLGNREETYAALLEYEHLLTKGNLKWNKKLAEYDVAIAKNKELVANTAPTKATIFWIDWSQLNNINNFERNFMWFNEPTNGMFNFHVSWDEIKKVFNVSTGILLDQLGYGAISLALQIVATNFAGNVLGIAGTTAHEGGQYFKLILANAGLISGYLGWVYSNFVLLPQYFVAYYLGRGDKETAYHNSMVMLNWSLFVGLFICIIVLIYGAFINYNIYPIHQNQTINTLVAAHFITWDQFYQDCFYMELILAIVEIFDASTALSYNILITGGCKWTFFIEQTFRILGTIVLFILNADNKGSAGVHWFNYAFGANMFVYYIIGRSHSVLPAFVAWIFIDEGTALRSVKDDGKITDNIKNIKIVAPVTNAEPAAEI